MSIMIKDLEMPTCCWDCPIQVNPFCAANNIIDFEERTKRPDKCPLTGVPEDVRPVEHGRWVFNKPPDDWIMSLYTCNQCGHLEEGKPNYCPNCGAKMDGET